MTPRWRLFPKYALLIMVLVGGLLIASGATSIYFSWRETERNLIDLQEEKAQAAAARIEQYILDIEHQLGWTTLPALEDAADPFEPRRTEYQKLFRLVPAITEVAWIDPNGREQVRISRVAVNVDGSNDDYSQAPKFKVAKEGKTYYGPVYFRKETEPYMTIARPAGLGGGVTAAEVNLKFVWEVVSRIKIGEKGLAYVVDDGGVLIAHPDISLVLRQTDLNSLPQVAALKQPGAPVAKQAKDIAGATVLSAHAAIPTLKWTVFVESPETEAFAPLYASILRAGLLLGAGLLAAMVASFFVARALVRPLQALQEGAARIGAGELDRRIEIRTGDELEGLAEQFNQMGAALTESYAGLERKVEARTAEVTEALERQTATAEVLKVISASPTDVRPVLEAVAERAGLLCKSEGSRVWLLVAGDKLRAMAEYGPSIGVEDELPLRRTSVAGRALIERKLLHVDDVVPLIESEYPDIRDIQARLGFRTVLAVPMLRDGEPIGVITLLRRWVQPFAEADIGLVRTFADQAVIAIENVRLFNETKEALDRQTATAEILRVISSSPSDVQPVFDAIATRARLLCAADSSAVRLPDGEVLRVRARDLSERALANRTPGGRDTTPILRTSITGRAFLEGRLLHIEDVQPVVDLEFPDVAGIVKRNNFRTVLVVPMLRDGRSIGTISLFRYTVRPFSGTEIDLVKTFADQAVIAIENVRLFNETREALQQQTATGEVLKVISHSVADTGPVFEKILESCKHLFASNEQGILLTGADGRLHLGAHHGSARPYLEKLFPLRWVGDGTPGGPRSVVHVRDVLGDADVPESLRVVAEKLGVGTYSQVITPMLWEGESIGSLYVIRQPPAGFTDKEIGLLRTFADQAVIAIQNARLFNETKEALEQQTATAEILQVISRSVADSQPVFEAILRSCERLFNGAHMGITLLGDDGRIHLRAHHGPVARLHDFDRSFPVPLSRESGSGSVILAREVQAYEDVDDPAVPATVKRSATAAGTRSVIFAPLLWEGRGIGAIFVGRKATGAFSDKDVALIRTFADQAVIAIQNARLFNETKEALEQQTATAEVLQVISSSVADTQPVFDKILDSCKRLFAANGMGIYLIDAADQLHAGGFRFEGALGQAVNENFPRPLAGTATEMAVRERRVVHFADVVGGTAVPEPLRRIAGKAGNYSIAFAPMLWEGRGVGAIQVSRNPPHPFTDKELALLKTFADQAVIAIQNARLFNEIAEKSRQLELANKHKSEFLANMSHELRTPLNAIIGFSEVLSERMFGEVNDKQLEYLQDIHTSGHHLLTLINDILDLSKIEAGRMELELASTSLPMLLDNCTTLVRERASRQGLVLALDMEDGIGEWVVDIRKLKQIVINLLSNAVKFTPAGGRVTLRARKLEHAVEIAVVDTGVGIPKDQQDLVFEEFRQAGGDYLRKSEGTGLGLSLARRFVELHGGTMRVESEPGRGSTFAFILPERVVEAV